MNSSLLLSFHLAFLTLPSSTLQVSIDVLVILKVYDFNRFSQFAWQTSDISNNHSYSSSWLCSVSRIYQIQSPIFLLPKIKDWKGKEDLISHNMECSLATEVKSIDISIIIKQDLRTLYSPDFCSSTLIHSVTKYVKYYFFILILCLPMQWSCTISIRLIENSQTPVQKFSQLHWIVLNHCLMNCCISSFL
jgi:hypothetical protein